MATLTTDQFIEAFSAKLIEEGQRVLRLNDPQVRDSLFHVYELLNREIENTRKEAVDDQSWRRSLVNIRNVFQPSPIGSFDKFESLMRAKQAYLTEHPNPYYQDIVFRLPAAAATSIMRSLDAPIRDIVERTVDRYLNREPVTS